MTSIALFKATSFVALLIALAPAHGTDCSSYAHQLETMRHADEGVRSMWRGQVMSVDFANSRVAQMTDLVDRRNTAQLKALVGHCGWPRKTVQGSSAVEAAWLIVQHTDDLALQERVLPMVRRAVELHEESGQDLASLEDRIAIAHDKPQRYGTQMQPAPPCGFDFLPIADATHVDERRSKLGLVPLAEYKKQVERTMSSEQCQATNDAPKP
jgi:hypothetical protein